MKPGNVKVSYWKEVNQLKGYPLREKIHGYIYLRWPYLYIGTGIGSTWIAKLWLWFSHLFSRFAPPPAPPDPDQITFADTYHGKVVPLQTAREIVTVHRDIAVPDLEQVIPYHLARAFILRQPDHIAVLECPCRANREHPCLPMDVCLIVGEPFTSFVLQHHPDKSRAITPDEAVAILEAEDQRGHVHHAFFKEAVMERFYAICNCCSCCCMGIKMWNLLEGTVPIIAPSGYLSHIGDYCNGCGECLEYCQFKAISLDENEQKAVIDAVKCMGCGVCEDICPAGAITLERDSSKGEPLDIEELVSKVKKEGGREQEAGV